MSLVAHVTHPRFKSVHDLHVNSLQEFKLANRDNRWEEYACIGNILEFQMAMAVSMTARYQ